MSGKIPDGWVRQGDGSFSPPRRLAPKAKELPHCDEFEGRESDLHDQIEAELKRRRWLYFHGSMAHRQMRTLGEPDFQVFADEGRFWLIECKTAKGKLSIEQMAIKLMAESLGHTVHIIRSYREFLRLIDD